MAGIVTFNPDLTRLKENLESICGQVREVILVDNHSENLANIIECTNNYNNVKLLTNIENKGIATALNQIMDYGYKNNFEWVLTLDQDSICPSDIIAEYEKSLSTLDKAAIIGAKIIDLNMPKNNIINDKTGEEIVDYCITSGSFTNVAIWNEVNGFDDSMFIDYVDIEYCYRVRGKGYKVYILNDVHLMHEIGKMKHYKFLFLNIPSYNHSAFRKYYITRNTLYFAKKYKDEVSMLKVFLQIIKRALIVILFEDNKKEKFMAMVRGFLDSKSMI